MEAHVVVGESIVLQNTIKAVEAKDVSVQSLVLQGMASAESTLTGDEREMGVVLLDIGAGTTDLVIYRQGAPWYSAVLPVGGYALTPGPGGSPAGAHARGRRGQDKVGQRRPGKRP